MIEFFTAHSDAVIALSSAVVGALFGCFGSYWIWWLERRRQRQIARMQIVINLRRWLQLMLYQISDINTWVDSDGSGGSIPQNILDFRFEESLEQVALLEHRMAMRIFKMIHKKDSANTEVDVEKEYGDDDDALDIMRNRIAQIWLRALAIYEQISEKVGWSEKTFSEKEKTIMQEEIDRYQKLEQERAKLNAAYPIF